MQVFFFISLILFLILCLLIFYFLSFLFISSYFCLEFSFSSGSFYFFQCFLYSYFLSLVFTFHTFFHTFLFFLHFIKAIAWTNAAHKINPQLSPQIPITPVHIRTMQRTAIDSPIETKPSCSK